MPGSPSVGVPTATKRVVRGALGDLPAVEDFSTLVECSLPYQLVADSHSPGVAHITPPYSREYLKEFRML